MTKWVFFAAMLAALTLGGCDRIQALTNKSEAKDSKGAAAQKVDAPASGSSAADSSGDDNGHNALFESEDSASRQRRERARASLGMGGK